MQNVRSIAGIVLAMCSALGFGCAHHGVEATTDRVSGATPSSGASTGATRAPDPVFTALVRDAYVYAYPYVLMDVTRETMTAVPAPANGHAPVNQFAHVRDFPDPTSHDVVRPNLDTLYSTAWLDLRDGPIVLGVPDTRGRYYLMQLLDASTNVFASIGKRATGTRRGAFAIVGPGFSGTLPDGTQKVEAPTNTVWVLGRTRVTGASDLAAVRRIQDQYALTPVAAYGTTYAPPAHVDVQAGISDAPPVRQVDAMDARTFFARFSDVITRNPPSPADTLFLATLVPIGIQPGVPFDSRKLAAAPDATERGLEEARRQILEGERSSESRHDGWEILGIRGTPIGAYGTHYMTRAHVARFGLGANLPVDAVYPNAHVDAAGSELVGANRYRIHFAPGQLPPANDFWSLTVYDTEGFIAPNDRRRYAIGDRDRWKRNRDGSLDLYLGHDSPGRSLESNWLPTPAGEFEVTMRVYGPRPEMLDGTWLPPGIEKQE